MLAFLDFGFVFLFRYQIFRSVSMGSTRSPAALPRVLCVAIESRFEKNSNIPGFQFRLHISKETEQCSMHQVLVTTFESVFQP